MLDNGTHEISTELISEIGDLDGKAESYKGIGLALAHTYNGDDWDLETSLSLGKRDYDRRHPEFGEKRDDARYGLETAYTLYNPLGFDNYFVTLFTAYDKRESNIDFYDASVLTTGAGIGFKF